MSGADIDRLPDPEAFRDALVLVRVGTWSPGDLDASDAMTLALVERMRMRATDG